MSGDPIVAVRTVQGMTMLHGSIRLSVLAGVTAFGAGGLTLALLGLGLPYLFASVLAALAAGLVMYAALKAQPRETPAEAAMRDQLEAYRTHSATMRHDLRGMLSPALMVSDRLLRHEDPKVQRAGQAVVKSIERATILLTESKIFMTPGTSPPEQARERTRDPAPTA